MSTPIERLDDVGLASDEQHAALYDLLVEAAADIEAGGAVSADRREEEAA